MRDLRTPRRQRAPLLLHGFPQTHLMWGDVAPRLASRFAVVCADLRGYGRSRCPASTPDHTPYAKRAMAADMAAVMARLGFDRFAVAGHDRGGRVAYRLALDHPRRVERIAVLDVLPTAEAWTPADARFALAFWPWALLAQPPRRYPSTCWPRRRRRDRRRLGRLGLSAGVFDDRVRAAYVEALRDPDRLHAICEEYRAAATLDRASGRRISCPLLALWSGSGPLGAWYADAGGPLTLWRAWADDVRGTAVAGGHFFPEERPAETVETLAGFFSGDA
jgi:haloacetate dehalogenase